MGEIRGRVNSPHPHSSLTGIEMFWAAGVTPAPISVLSGRLCWLHMKEGGVVFPKLLPIIWGPTAVQTVSRHLLTGRRRRSPPPRCYPLLKGWAIFMLGDLRRTTNRPHQPSSAGLKARPNQSFLQKSQGPSEKGPYLIPWWLDGCRWTFPVASAKLFLTFWLPSMVEKRLLEVLDAGRTTLASGRVTLALAASPPVSGTNLF